MLRNMQIKYGEQVISFAFNVYLMSLPTEAMGYCIRLIQTG